MDSFGIIRFGDFTEDEVRSFQTAKRGVPKVPSKQEAPKVTPTKKPVKIADAKGLPLHPPVVSKLDASKPVSQSQTSVPGAPTSAKPDASKPVSQSQTSVPGAPTSAKPDASKPVSQSQTRVPGAPTSAMPDASKPVSQSQASVPGAPTSAMPDASKPVSQSQASVSGAPTSAKPTVTEPKSASTQSVSETQVAEAQNGQAIETLNCESKSWASLVSQNDNAGIAAGVARSANFLPRGLVNTGNTCFLNSTLQALLSCSPFCGLLKDLGSQTVSQDEYPLLHAFGTLASQLEDNSPSQATEKFYRKGGEEVKFASKDVEVAKPLTPAMFDPILQSFNPAHKNRQEDAQEFLSFMMNKMHDEFIKLEGREPQEAPVVGDFDEWETVGPKNRTAVTRTYNFSKSPLSEIFGGQQNSVVKVRGTKPSATIQPFYLLHLDISSQSVRSVEDALRVYSTVETLEGYKSATGKTEDASRSVKIVSLPKVLILHLMRFQYGDKGVVKLYKPVKFPRDLTLGREMLASSSEGSRKYELVATITHHGKEPSSGHYTADTRQPAGHWLRFDDPAVALVRMNEVLHDQAYLLFYRRVQ